VPKELADIEKQRLVVRLIANVAQKVLVEAKELENVKKKPLNKCELNNCEIYDIILYNII